MVIVRLITVKGHISQNQFSLIVNFTDAMIKKNTLSKTTYSRKGLSWLTTEDTLYDCGKVKVRKTDVGGGWLHFIHS